MKLRVIETGNPAFAAILDDYLPRLNEFHRDCETKDDERWLSEGLLAELDRITGTSNFTDLFRKHVMDDEFPDVNYTFEQLGLILRSDAIRFDPDAPWGRIRYYIMNG